jgi:hypothetical protein
MRSYEQDAKAKECVVICDGGTIEAYEWGREFTNCGKTGKFELKFTDNEAEFRGRELASYDALGEAVLSEWQHGIELFDKMQSDIQAEQLPTPKSRRRTGVWSEDDGDDFNFDRFRTGAPFWRTSKRRSGNGPNVVTICVDVGGNCNIDHEALIWRGVAAVSAAKVLERAGYRVELWACCSLSGAFRDGFGLFMGVRLKRHNDRLDITSLINGISGWFFRSVLFSLVNVCEGRTPEYGLGQHRGSKAFIHHIANANAIMVEDCWNRKTALEAIRKLIPLAVGEANLVEC